MVYLQDIEDDVDGSENAYVLSKLQNENWLSFDIGEIITVLDKRWINTVTRFGDFCHKNLQIKLVYFEGRNPSGSDA